MPAAQAPCISSFPSRLLASTLLGYFKWCPNLPRVFVLGSALLYGLVLPTRLIAAAYLGVKLLLEAHGLHSVSGRRPKERAAADWWLNLLKTRAKALRADIFEALVFAAWAPFAPVALVLALAEAVSLLRLRLVGGDVVVRVQQNICMHGFMVMPEIVVNSILTLDALCGPRVRVRVEMGAKTMDGGKHPYFSSERGGNVWRHMFDDALSATDEPDSSSAARGATTFGYFLHCAQHHMWGTFFYPHAAGASTAALPPYWLGSEAEFAALPYTRQLHEWYGEQRRLFHTVLRRIQLRPAKPIREEAQLLWRTRFGDRPKLGPGSAAGPGPGPALGSGFVLGVHMRGTDKAHSGGIVYPAAYYPYIDHFLARGASLFLATDSPRFLAEVRAKYGERVAFLSCLREQHNVAWDLKRDGYTKGKEVLLDATCLAKCDFLLYSHSGVPEFALRTNPALHDHSINLSFDPASQFDLGTGGPTPLVDAPVPWLHRARRAVLGATWWPLQVLQWYVVQALWMLQMRLLDDDLATAQREIWHNVEKKREKS